MKRVQCIFTFEQWKAVSAWLTDLGGLPEKGEILTVISIRDGDSWLGRKTFYSFAENKWELFSEAFRDLCSDEELSEYKEKVKQEFPELFPETVEI